MEYSTQKLPFFNIISSGDDKMDVIFLISTALSVSLDSFLCGLSLFVPTKDRNKAVLIIAVSVLLLCFIGAFLGLKLGIILSKFASKIAGAILILIAFLESFEKEEDCFLNVKQHALIDYFLAGFAVGLDGLVGSFTLSLLDYNPALVTFIITILHVFLLYVSISISTKYLQRHAFIKRIAPVFIFILGFYKVLC